MMWNSVSWRYFVCCLGLGVVTLQSSANGWQVEPQRPSTPSKGLESSRRVLLQQTLIATSAMVIPSSANAITRAIGGAEEECRAAGNCLEIGEWDGAIGWRWGSKDRCDPADALCGTDGKMREEALTGDPVPQVTNKVTAVVEMTYSVGRGETGVLRMGLYGDDAKVAVDQFLQFVTGGLRTTSDLVFESGMGVETVPVSLSRGGILGQILPVQRIDFGIPLQSAAYARSKGLSKVSEDFMAQPRPKPIDIPEIRPHSVAGLVSVPGKGLGWGGTGFENDDECFESSFQITASPSPSMDKKEGRRVIGQLIDQESMSNLARLASLPTKKGFKGVIPGQISGPPLLKVTINDVSVISGQNS